MKARGRLVIVAWAALLALAVPAGASARVGAHRRHVEVIEPTAAANLLLGTHGGYEVSVVFEDPDSAVLVVSKFDRSRLGTVETKYGAHLHGSLLSGHVSADFGGVGSLAVRFREDSAKERPAVKGCEGRRGRNESGRWVGRISLHGEGDYFAVKTGSAAGNLYRTFRLRCQVKRPLPRLPHESLRRQVEPHVGSSLASLLLGTISSVEAANREDGRRVEMRAAHATGTGPGAEVEAGVFEYQGRMPVGRFAQILEAPPGSLVTTLPGEHPASATLKPGPPFSGEASYLVVSPTDHSWTGSLAVRLPGLVVPLAGPRFFSSFCVLSPLVKPLGCEFQTPSWQTGEEATTNGARR